MVPRHGFYIKNLRSKLISLHLKKTQGNIFENPQETLGELEKNMEIMHPGILPGAIN